MRGSLAKHLRRRTLAAVPTNVLLSLAEEPRYTPVNHTTRAKDALTGRVIFPADLHRYVTEKLPYFTTVTFALAADCRRHYTQRLKRAYVRQQRRAA